MRRQVASERCALRRELTPEPLLGGDRLPRTKHCFEPRHDRAHHRAHEVFTAVEVEIGRRLRQARIGDDLVVRSAAPAIAREVSLSHRQQLRTSLRRQSFEPRKHHSAPVVHPNGLPVDTSSQITAILHEFDHFPCERIERDRNRRKNKAGNGAQGRVPSRRAWTQRAR